MIKKIQPWWAEETSNYFFFTPHCVLSYRATGMPHTPSSTSFIWKPKQSIRAEWKLLYVCIHKEPGKKDTRTQPPVCGWSLCKESLLLWIKQLYSSAKPLMELKTLQIERERERLCVCVCVCVCVCESVCERERVWEWEQESESKRVREGVSKRTINGNKTELDASKLPFYARTAAKFANVT